MTLLREDESVMMEGSVKEVAKKGGQGILTLTNKQIIFERIEGSVSQKKNIVFEVPLSGIVNVTVKWFILKKLVLKISWLENPRQYKFETNKAREWLTAIRSVRRQR